MKTSHFLMLAGFLIAGLLSLAAFANTQPISSSAEFTSQNAERPKFEYATLTTQAIQQNNGMVYTVTWNNGELDVIGRSTNSLVDARRKLTSQIGNSNKTRTNLSVLLTSIGSDGWRLVESTQNEFGITRILVRPQQ